jgi:hypothetical protein
VEYGTKIVATVEESDVVVDTVELDRVENVGSDVAKPPVARSADTLVVVGLVEPVTDAVTGAVADPVAAADVELPNELDCEPVAAAVLIEIEVVVTGTSIITTPSTMVVTTELVANDVVVVVEVVGGGSGPKTQVPFSSGSTAVSANCAGKITR